MQFTDAARDAHKLARRGCKCVRTSSSSSTTTKRALWQRFTSRCRDCFLHDENALQFSRVESQQRENGEAKGKARALQIGATQAIWCRNTTGNKRQLQQQENENKQKENTVARSTVRSQTYMCTLRNNIAATAASTTSLYICRTI